MKRIKRERRAWCGLFVDGTFPNWAWRQSLAQLKASVHDYHRPAPLPLDGHAYRARRNRRKK